MRPFPFYLIVIFFYLAIPVLAIGLLGTMVSDKYQVEQARIFVEIYSDKETIEETNAKLETIDKFEKQLRLQQIGLVVTMVIFFVTSTVLLIKRNKVLKA